MKIKPEHFEHIKASIKALGNERIQAIKAHVEACPKAKDKDRRFRWDLLYSARLSTWICDNLYEYMDDSHIDTALKRIVAEVVA